jgi:protein phosphatase
MSREDIPPQKWHTLTQAVGLGEDIIPEQLNIDLHQGDFLLLCSDGLTGMLTDEEIKETIKKNINNIDKALDRLIKRANEKGGRDNITVILVKYGG